MSRPAEADAAPPAVAGRAGDKRTLVLFLFGALIALPGFLPETAPVSAPQVCVETDRSGYWQLWSGSAGGAGEGGDTCAPSGRESRGQALRRVVEQFDEKDKFEFMLLDGQGVILATSSGTMSRDLTDGTDYGRALTSANGLGSAIFTTPNGERVMVPPYIAAGTRVVILTEDWTYSERAKD